MRSKVYFLMTLLLLIVSANDSSAQVKSYKKTNFGVSFLLQKGMMNLYLLKNDLVEVKYTTLESMPEKKSLVVLPVDTYLKNFSTAETNGNIMITTDKLKIKVDRQTQAITYSDLKNNIILAESADENKQMRDTTVAGIKTFSVGTTFQSPKDEALYGLGCHPE